MLEAQSVLVNEYHHHIHCIATQPSPMLAEQELGGDGQELGTIIIQNLLKSITISIV